MLTAGLYAGVTGLQTSTNCVRSSDHGFGWDVIDGMFLEVAEGVGYLLYCEDFRAKLSEILMDKLFVTQIVHILLYQCFHCSVLR